jgi:flagellar motor switch/type III secretory pathway protein FliN
VTGQGQISADSNGDVERWDPRAVVRSMDPLEARISNGFLRSHPERWCPGLAERWAPLMSTVGCDLRVTEIKPSRIIPNTSQICFLGALDDAPIVLAIDEQSANYISEEVIPRTGHVAHAPLIIDYIAQRLIAALGMCQIISESAGVTYRGRCDVSDVPLVASVKLTCSVQSHPCSMLIGLGEDLVEKMDRLWRRQVYSSNRQAPGEGQLRMELAQLGVPPQMLSEYLSKGTVIDLESRVSDAITLRVGHKVFMPARLIDVAGKLGCQTIQGAASNVTIPEGTSRLSIEFASQNVEPSVLAELGQVGAVFLTDQPLTERVALSINQERVAEARLCVYQGRYAVEVL